MKSELSSDDVLVPFHLDLPFKLITDVSQYGIGGFISHMYPDEQGKPIAYASRIVKSS